MLTNRRQFVFGATGAALFPTWRVYGGSPPDRLWEGFAKPDRTYRPRTRWWWPGNAVTKAQITAELADMNKQGLGGVEVMSTWNFYETPGPEFLSGEHIELLKHTVKEGRRLGMNVSITFGSGWSFGGPWVRETDRSKCLVHTHIDVVGGSMFSGPLPPFQPRAAKLIHFDVDPTFASTAPDENTLVAAVAVPLQNGAEVVAQAQLLPADDDGRLKPWLVPSGHWRIFGCWLRYTGQQNSAQNFSERQWVVDHLNPAAVSRYFDFVSQKLAHAFGSELGRTVDSFFCDSFEVVPLPDGIMWTNDICDAFLASTGRDLRPLLPALWVGEGDLVRQVRYEVNRVLHERGLAVMATFDTLCRRIKVQARMQPQYRFTEEIVQGAGTVERPEAEVTTARYETVEDPRKAIVSGARYYGRDHVSAEAFTFLHKTRYSATLQEMKIATDAFLRDGITQLYNHGYLASAETTIAPARDMPWGNAINPRSPWWRYYKHLADYTASACFLLRQGQPVSDIAIYSPHATRWSRRAVWNTERRFINYRGLGNLLVRSGYDFEIINDDVLQTRAVVRTRALHVAGLRHKAVILPDIEVIPLKTLQRLADFVRGGGLVVALGQLPQCQPGFAIDESTRAQTAALCEQIWGNGGAGVLLPDFKLPWHSEPAPWGKPAVDAFSLPGADSLVAALRSHVPPDVETVRDTTPGEGLAWAHRVTDSRHVFFFANMSDRELQQQVRLRDRVPNLQVWDPVARTRKNVPAATITNTSIGLCLGPWQSIFVVSSDRRLSPRPAAAKGAPIVSKINGPWQLHLEGTTHELPSLVGWHTMSAHHAHCGQGEYEVPLGPYLSGWDGRAPVQLDLGVVADVAEVFVDGLKVGTLWTSPYRIDLTPQLRRTSTRLRVLVTNGLANAVGAMSDAETPVPTAVSSRWGERRRDYDEGIKAFERDRREPRAPAGLMGPVTLVVSR